jgi:hypothetical protein
MNGTEMLIEAMGRWGDHSEPTAVLLVYTDAAGEVWMKTNCPHTQAVGMAEYAKHFLLATLLAQPEEDRG